MMPKTKLFWVAAVVLPFAACTSARRSEPIIGPTPAKGAAFAEGRRLFMQYCHACHPAGEAGLGPAINNKPLPAALIKFQVRHGLGAMPAFKDHLDQDELDAVAAYLIALRRS
jgi:mono/diheme cytochrome c family protein